MTEHSSDPVQVPEHNPGTQPRLPRLQRWLGKITGPREVAGSREVPESAEPESGATDFEFEPESQDENYDEEMTAWKSHITSDLEKLRGEMDINSAKATRSWALIQKLNEQKRAGREWVDEGRLAWDGIKRRYGSQTQLRDTEEDLAARMHRRNRQLDYAQNFNSVLEFADEIDPSVYRRYIPLPNQLGERFNLPKTSHPTTDPEQAAAELNSLPFVRWGELQKAHGRKHPSIVIDGHFDFPTERVIGVASFESWAGRGERVGGGRYAPYVSNGQGSKSFTPRALPDIEKTSRGAITDFAQLDPAPLKDIGHNAHIVMVQDADGEYWGIATEDGSHRMAAAKLRGDPTVAVNKIEISSDEDIPKLDFSVKERFGAGEGKD